MLVYPGNLPTLSSSEHTTRAPTLTASNRVGGTQHVGIPCLTELYISIIRRSDLTGEHVLTSGIQQIKWRNLACWGSFIYFHSSRDQLVLDP